MRRGSTLPLISDQCEHELQAAGALPGFHQGRGPRRQSIAAKSIHVVDDITCELQDGAQGEEYAPVITNHHQHSSRLPSTQVLRLAMHLLVACLSLSGTSLAGRHPPPPLPCEACCEREWKGRGARHGGCRCCC